MCSFVFTGSHKYKCATSYEPMVQNIVRLSCYCSGLENVERTHFKKIHRLRVTLVRVFLKVFPLLVCLLKNCFIILSFCPDVWSCQICFVYKNSMYRPQTSTTNCDSSDCRGLVEYNHFEYYTSVTGGETASQRRRRIREWKRERELK